MNRLFNHDREVFILFAGKNRMESENLPSRSFRYKILKELTKITDKPFEEFISGTPNGSVNSVFYKPGKCSSPPYTEYTTEWMRHSIFCLQPPGDTNSRKSFYDAIISGCIPVLFELPYLSHVTYPFERYIDYSKFTVTVPLGETFYETLDRYKLGSHLIHQLQMNLKKVMPLLQYNDPSSYNVGNDAFSMIIKEIQDKLKFNSTKFEKE